MIVAHGIGGIRDLPVPTSYFVVGAGVVLVLSFAALAALWRRPLLERHAGGRPLPAALERVLLSRALRGTVGALSLALLLLVWLAAAIGERAGADNLAPTFVYVVFWLGLVPLSVLLGDVWRALNPWKAAADGAAWLWSRLGRDYEPPFRYPEEALGRLPAAVGLLAFAALELAYVEPSSPRALAVAIAVYSWATWLGMAAFGRRAWLENGEAFTSYFGLLASAAPLARRGERIVVRPPLTGLASSLDTPGTIPFLAVMLGSVAFDGFSRSSWWQDAYYEVQLSLLERPDLADLAGILMSVGVLVGFVAVAGAAYRLAVAGAEWIAQDGRRLAHAFVSSLIPIALVYAVAHYFSLLVLQGQVAVKLASDPFGWGWDLLSTAGFRPDFGILTPNTVWYVQVAALVAGHVAGLAVAHDRAVALFRPRLAAWTQLPLLALMILYTVGGLWLLSRS